MRVTSRTKSRLVRGWLTILSISLTVAAVAGVCRAESESGPDAHVTIVHGATNGVCIERNGSRLLIYGDPQQQWKTADTVLFTHSRRDVVWAGRPLVDGGAKSVVPANEARQFSAVGTFWTDLWDKRFHDYAQQGTKVPTTPMRVDRAVREGDRIEWESLTFRVLETPGYTRGAVSYFVEIDGQKHGFIGDLMYGDGQLMDLYSLQDAVKEAEIGGYHGHAGRLGQLIESLRNVLAQQADVLVPARGPVVRDPRAAVTRLIERVRGAYENYLSVSAGRWYFKDRYDILAARVLQSPEQVRWMPYARTVEKAPPDWIIPIHNSRLIIARDRAAFLIDCGSQAIFQEVRKLQETGRVTSVDGLFITHYHDDHTDWVNEFLDVCECPVYVTPVMEDVLRRPGAYRLPAMTGKPIAHPTVVPDGHRMRWKEFALTFYDFPGQTIYHDALLVERDGGQTIFFVGDSFTPSGMDDYCLQNRNLLHGDTGYLYCLDLLKDSIPAKALLINQHVLEPFRFDADQIDLMVDALEKRTAMLYALFPWDEANYGIDEQWACLYPYGQEARPGEWVEVTVKLWNHSKTSSVFTVRLHAPAGFACEREEATVTAEPGQQVDLGFRVRAARDTAPSVHVVTADIRFGPWDLRQWCEALVKVVE